MLSSRFPIEMGCNKGKRAGRQESVKHSLPGRRPGDRSSQRDRPHARIEHHQRDRLNDTSQVIGTGFGRTGTVSLRHALNILDQGPCHHMHEVMPSDAQRVHRDRKSRGGPGRPGHHLRRLRRRRRPAVVRLPGRTHGRPCRGEGGSHMAQPRKPVDELRTHGPAGAAPIQGGRENVHRLPDRGGAGIRRGFTEKAACIARYNANVERVRDGAARRSPAGHGTRRRLREALGPSRGRGAGYAMSLGQKERGFPQGRRAGRATA